LDQDGVEFFNTDAFVFQDQRGKVFAPFDQIRLDLLNPGSIHMVITRPGAVRGNHFHPRSREWIFFMSGQATLYWKGDKEKEVRKKVIMDGQTLAAISHGVPHTVVNTGEQDQIMLCLREESLPLDGPVTVKSDII